MGVHLKDIFEFIGWLRRNFDSADNSVLDDHDMTDVLAE